MGAIRSIVTPRERDLGGFSVRRILPAAGQRSVGPFVFLDHMGPATFPPGQGVDVRPHPHIGLATVTWLYAGELMHRDSLGCVQVIRPGEVNWMTAGRGIVHSERTPAERRTGPSPLHGLQSWVALPREAEDTEPEFHHHGAGELPAGSGNGARWTLIAGALFGQVSPVRTFSPMGYAAVEFDAGGRLELAPEYAELAVYVVEGSVGIDGQDVPTGSLAVLASGASAGLRTTGPARCAILGGAPLDGPRHLWWNFVVSSEDRLERAKRDWQEGRFPPVPGETEFIPLPPA